MGRFRVLFVLFLCALLPMPRAAAEEERETLRPEQALRLGIVPFNAAASLLRVHQPLRDYLARILDREVIIYSARSHERFLESLLAGRFDMVIVPVHFLPAAVDKGFVPLVRYANQLELLMVVRNDSKIEKVDDLRGRRIGVPDRLSLYNLVATQWLRETGLHPGKDYLLCEQASHMAVMMAVAADRVDAALSSRPPWAMLDEKMRGRLRLIDVGYPGMPSLTTLARDDLGTEEVERIRAALRAFPEEAEGRAFFVATDFGGYVAVTKEDVAAARRYELERHRTMAAQEDYRGDASCGRWPDE